jgi:hypothetical protein
MSNSWKAYGNTTAGNGRLSTSARRTGRLRVPSCTCSSAGLSAGLRSAASAPLLSQCIPNHKACVLASSTVLADPRGVGIVSCRCRARLRRSRPYPCAGRGIFSQYNPDSIRECRSDNRARASELPEPTAEASTAPFEALVTLRLPCAARTGRPSHPQTTRHARCPIATGVEREERGHRRMPSPDRTLSQLRALQRPPPTPNGYADGVRYVQTTLLATLHMQPWHASLRS